MHNQDCTLGLAPAAGGSVLNFRRAGRNLLRPAASADAVARDPRGAACFPCVPYFGRLHGGLAFGGRHWPQAPTLAVCDPSLALHGEGWVGGWEVVTQTADRLTCRFSHRGKPGRFPFAYEAFQEFSLAESGLSIRLSIANAGREPMPAGLGLHPYFARSPTTTVAVSARRMWTPGPAGGGALGDLPDRLGSSAAAPLPLSTLDHSFTEFGGEAVVAADMTIRLVSDAPILHIYAPAGEDFFCLEPVTHLPGDFAKAGAPFGGRTLAPGESMSLAMAIGPH